MEKREGDFGEFDELPDDGMIDWAITRALLSASDATTAALEMHLVQAQFRDGSDADPASIRRHIDEAIDHHEQIIEDLRFAREGLSYSEA